MRILGSVTWAPACCVQIKKEEHRGELRRGLAVWIEGWLNNDQSVGLNDLAAAACALSNTC